MIQQERVKYFLGNIFEAKCAYRAWRSVVYADTKQLAKNITKIKECHTEFFVLIEKALLVMWVILIHHVFDDKRLDSFSLDKADKKEYSIFYKKHLKIIEQIKKVRSKLFAHRDIAIKPEKIKLPGIKEMDKFFEDLERLYNKISYKIEKHIVTFDFANDFKEHLYELYKDIERGEKVRIKEINQKHRTNTFN